jgi:hypothetical protein
MDTVNFFAGKVGNGAQQCAMVCKGARREENISRTNLQVPEKYQAPKEAEDWIAFSGREHLGGFSEGVAPGYDGSGRWPEIWP